MIERVNLGMGPNLRPTASANPPPRMASSAFLLEPQGLDIASSQSLSISFHSYLLCSPPPLTIRWPPALLYSNYATSIKPRHSFTNNSVTSSAGIYIKAFSQACKVKVWRGSSSIWTMYFSLGTTLLHPMSNVGVGSRWCFRSRRPPIPGILIRA